MEPFSFILLQLALIIGLAAVGRGLALKFNQSAVLGELMVGVLLGNIAYWFGSPLATIIMHFEEAQKIIDEVWSTGSGVYEAAQHIDMSHGEAANDHVSEALSELMVGPQGTELLFMTLAFWLFSNLGVILLLFMVGLQNTVGEMMTVGKRSLMVSIMGVVAPFMLGLMTSYWLLPDLSTPAHLFIGATLCATSVGITARVLGDLGHLKSHESRIILGAAVIDDILGLVILAIVIGIVSSGTIQLNEVTRIIFFSLAFIIIVVKYGEGTVSWIVGKFYHIFNKMQVRLLFPLALAFLMAAFANFIGLAAIVGAFAAGLIVCDDNICQHKRFGKEVDGLPSTQELIQPIQSLFAPVFFVLMGMQVNLETFLQTETIWLAAAFTIVAIIGKVVSGWAAGKGVDRLSIGLGMVPRGEVGLIFASIGKGLGVISVSVFSAIVIMVIVTTLITPIALKWSLDRGKSV